MKNKTNSFEKFVKTHEKLKLRRHNQGEKYYSDYDSMIGISMMMIPIGFFFISPFAGSMAITMTILFLIMNNTDFTPSEK